MFKIRAEVSVIADCSNGFVDEKKFLGVGGRMFKPVRSIRTSRKYRSWMIEKSESEQGPEMGGGERVAEFQT